MNGETSSDKILRSNVSSLHKLTNNTDERISANDSSPQRQERNDSGTLGGRRFIYSLDSIRKWIWTCFIKPKADEEDERRREFLLNVILCSFLSLLFLLTLIYIDNGLNYPLEYKVLSALCLLLIWGTFSSLLYLSRRGWVRTSAYGLIGLITLFSTMGAVEWGFDLPAVIISYLLIIVISGILFNISVGIQTTIVLTLLIFSIGYYQTHIEMPNLYWRMEDPEMIDALSFSLELFFIMGLAWLSNNEMNKSLKRARDSEERLSNELERVMRVYHFAEFGKLSSGAFHDLMNPLTSISLNLKEIENDVHPDIGDAKKYLDIAIHASRRMENFIVALGKQIKSNDAITRFILNEEIEHAIDLMSFKARKSKCEISFVAEEEIEAFGNSLSFYQTMVTLVSNAIDAYEDNSRHNKPITIDLSRDQSSVLVKISDQGCGMSKEIVDKIFDPFFTTKPGNKGLGLGLAVSKERIEKDLNGTLSVSSNKDHGSTFTISIPQADSNASP